MNSSSPNAQKSGYEKMLCLARALMAYCPAALEVGVEGVRLHLEHPELIDKWVEMRGDIGVEHCWYVMNRSDGSGQSRPDLPEGVQATAAVFELRRDQPVHALFRQMVGTYLDGVESRDLIDRFNRMVAACDEGYGGECVARFRNWLGRHGERPIPEQPELVVVMPDQLISFCKEVATLRANYAADAMLMGSMGTAGDICMTVAGGEDDANFKFDVFSHYAWFITSSEELHPPRLASGIVQQAIREGFLPQLLKIGDNYRERVESKIKAAKAAGDIDAHLNCLYEALPYAGGAYLIYSRLTRFATEASAADRQIFVGAKKQVDETLARLLPPFVNQVLDLDGHVWAIHKAIIDRARRDKGGEAASDQARFYIDSQLYYPETMLGHLLQH